MLLILYGLLLHFFQLSKTKRARDTGEGAAFYKKDTQYQRHKYFQYFGLTCALLL